MAGVNIKKIRFNLQISRFLIATVIAINLQCALLFLVKPELFTPRFELDGLVGQAAIQGYGVLFFMWNIPYIIACINPVKFVVSFYTGKARLFS